MSSNYYFFFAVIFSCDGENTTPKNDNVNDTVEEVPIVDSGENTTDQEDTSNEDISVNEECAEYIVEPLPWFEYMSTNKAEGDLYFGQTHVIEKDEQRLAT